MMFKKMDSGRRLCCVMIPQLDLFIEKEKELSIIDYAIPLDNAHLIRRSPTTELKQEVFGFVLEVS